jgi:aminoglycoside phosphotransferase (APT) family kinase protein
MTSLLLAHMLSQQHADAQYADIRQEVIALRSAEHEEQSILTAGSAAAAPVEAMTADVLTDYLRLKLARPGLEVTAVHASLGGFSKQTYILTLTGAGDLGTTLVLRRDQAGGPVEVPAAHEYPVMKLMHERGVSVAEPLLVDRDPPFGATVLVMRHVAGRSAFDVTGQHLGAGGRDAAFGLARILAQVHRTPVAAMQLPDELVSLPLREHIRMQVQLYESQWRRRSVGPSPTLEAAFGWLYANIPEVGSGPALVHGDASLRNLLVHEGRESALLDWELWHVGDANEDIVYCRNEVESAVAWDEFIDEYNDHGGLPFYESVGDFYTMFGAVRNAVFAQSCLHGFLGAEDPEGKFAYGALVLGRRLVYRIAEMLEVADATPA